MHRQWSKLVFTHNFMASTSCKMNSVSQYRLSDVWTVWAKWHWQSDVWCQRFLRLLKLTAALLAPTRYIQTTSPNIMAVTRICFRGCIGAEAAMYEAPKQRWGSWGEAASPLPQLCVWGSSVNSPSSVRGDRNRFRYVFNAVEVSKYVSKT